MSEIKLNACPSGFTLKTRAEVAGAALRRHAENRRAGLGQGSQAADYRRAHPPANECGIENPEPSVPIEKTVPRLLPVPPELRHAVNVVSGLDQRNR